MAQTTTVILGGGFGGLSCARALRARLPAAHRIVLVDRSPDFIVGATKTWVMLGEKTPEEVPAPREKLLPPGVERVQAHVTGIDAAGRSAATSAGPFHGDHLVIALGAELDLGAVPGLSAAAHMFYTLHEAARLNRALLRFQGGRILLLIPRTPYQCPPGPYEAALLIHAWLERRGIRAKTDLAIWTVEKAPMPTAGPDMGAQIVGELSSREVGFHPLKKAVAVDGGRRSVRFEDGTEEPYDLLIAIPPHRAPRAAVEAGLAAPGGWIEVDPATFAVKAPGAAPHVYAVGDAAGVPLPGRWDPAVSLALPKAGIFAAAQGELVADEIAASVLGGAVTATFEGRGHCFIEVGNGRAMRADGDFFHTPHPVMAAKPPDEAQYREKVAWVAGWLARQS